MTGSVVKHFFDAGSGHSTAVNKDRGGGWPEIRVTKECHQGDETFVHCKSGERYFIFGSKVGQFFLNVLDL